MRGFGVPSPATGHILRRGGAIAAVAGIAALALVWMAPPGSAAGPATQLTVLAAPNPVAANTDFALSGYLSGTTPAQGWSITFAATPYGGSSQTLAPTPSPVTYAISPQQQPSAYTTVQAP